MRAVFKGVVASTRSIKLAFCIAAASLSFAASSFGQTAFAVEFNQANNRYGVINLTNGVFTQSGTMGNTIFNDIAQAPGAGGVLYGIRNSANLVRIDQNTGTILSSLNFNVGGIQSLAMSSSGTLYAATQSSLYTVNVNTANATLVGNFNLAALNGRAQNIRFGSDGLLYTTDAGVSAIFTDLFRINVNTGAATMMGVLNNLPDLVLENAGGMLYGVGIQIGGGGTLTQDLVGIDLSTLPGGNGAVTYNLLTPNFPNNFNFSSSTTFIVPAPEPGALTLSVVGGVMLVFINRNRRR